MSKQTKLKALREILHPERIVSFWRSLKFYKVNETILPTDLFETGLNGKRVERKYSDIPSTDITLKMIADE